MMATLKYLILGWVMLLGFALSAQQLIEVGWDKTTYLVFDSAIESVDRGSRALLSQRDEVGLNLLKLKAGSKDFGSTNLHVLTADGRLHDFNVLYADSPAELTVDLRTAKVGLEASALTEAKFTQAAYEAIHEKIDKGLSEGPSVSKTSAYQMDLRLEGLYFEQGVLFFYFNLGNQTLIPFALSRVEINVKDRKSGKRSSRRSVAMTPLYNSADEQTVFVQGTNQTMLLAFEVFTIADKKKLEFSFYELHGDRQLHLSITGKKLLKAEYLPISNLNQTTNGSGKF